MPMQECAVREIVPTIDHNANLKTDGWSRYPVISQMFSSGCRANVPSVGWVTEYRANLLKNHHAVFLQCKNTLPLQV